MKALFDVPINQRDEHWENQFLLQLPTARVKLLNEVPQSGPDGWPYMMVELSPEPTAEPIEKLLVWLSDKGIGLVVNPKKDVPDYVLTYGMIWNFIVRGGFVTRTNDSETSGAASVSEKIQIEEGTEVVGGEPTVEYLPDYVRNVLRLARIA